MGNRRVHLVGPVICLVAAVITGHVAVGCDGGGGGGSAPAPVAPVTPALHLTFVVPPEGAPAGARFLSAVQVAVQDTRNRTVTSATNDITLTIVTGSSSGSLGGSTTVRAVNGIATFSDLTVSSNGGYSVVAATAGATSATSPPFTIAAFVASDGLGHLDGPGMNFARFGPNDMPDELGLHAPSAVAVDSDLHRLWIADRFADRVLLFTLSSTDDLSGQALAATRVLGADDFKSFRFVNPPARDRMVQPGGVACDVAGRRLFVADTANSRVLVFDVSLVTDGMDATHVLGQQDFTTIDIDTALDSLDHPTGLAHDPTTNLLFVADTGHDRILVFDVSTITNGEPAVHAIGQASGGMVTATTLDLDLAPTVPTGLAVDPGSRLFVSDPGAHRVLAFDISAGVSTGMAAVAALGQPDLSSSGSPSATDGASFTHPTGLWHDATADQLFVVDLTGARVLVFDTIALSSGDTAIKVLGQATFATAVAATSASGLSAPEAAAGAVRRLIVADTQNHRVLSFETTTLDDGEDAVGGLGHADAAVMDFTRGEIGDAAFADAFEAPHDVLLDPTGHRLFVADSENNRVLVFELSAANDFGGVDRVADIVLGQTDLKGREPSRAAAGLIGPRGLALAGGRLFVADTGNTRVVIHDATALATGAAPIALLGAPVAGNGGDGAAEMSAPWDVEVDATADRLFVADEGNNRVLVFEGASALVTGDPADHVLGQTGFDLGGAGGGSAGMNKPRAVVHDGVTNRLFVADSWNQRVLVFEAASLTDGQAAVAVLGQADLTTTSFAVFGDPTKLSFPAVLGLDRSRRRLFVSGGSGGSGVALFDVTSVANGEAAISSIGEPSLGGPTGVVAASGIAVDEATGRVFVSDAENHRVLRFDLP